MGKGTWCFFPGAFFFTSEKASCFWASYLYQNGFSIIVRIAGFYDLYYRLYGMTNHRESLYNTTLGFSGLILDLFLATLQCTCLRMFKLLTSYLKTKDLPLGYLVVVMFIMEYLIVIFRKQTKTNYFFL